MVPASTAEVYRCPGEHYDITRPVHLARLAMSYAKCRHCPFAPGAPALRDSSEAGIEPATLRGISLFTAEGVRGLYLNALTRATAANIAGAMASCLWDDVVVDRLRATGTFCLQPEAEDASPSESESLDSVPDSSLAAEGFRLLAPGRPGPTVVLGHDERPSAPDIVTGVGQSLRRMGCQVVDIGMATRPCLMFAIDHLHAAGAVHVTGAGCDPGWTGLDFLTRGGIPCSTPGDLERIARRFREGFSRPSRRPGTQRTFQAAVPYEAGLWKHFHALRPLKIAVACPGRTVRDLFTRVFRKLACRLLVIETPTRGRVSLDPTDPDLERVSRRIHEIRPHLGALADEDGERCSFFDEQGRFVPPSLMARVLAADFNDAPGRPNPESASNAARGGSALGTSREAITSAMLTGQLPFAADGTGRYWFREAYPACDALLTLVHLLQVLSRSDRPFSEVVARA